VLDRCLLLIYNIITYERILIRNDIISFSVAPNADILSKVFLNRINYLEHNIWIIFCAGVARCR